MSDSGGAWLHERPPNAKCPKCCTDSVILQTCPHLGGLTDELRRAAVPEGQRAAAAGGRAPRDSPAQPPPRVFEGAVSSRKLGAGWRALRIGVPAQPLSPPPLPRHATCFGMSGASDLCAVRCALFAGGRGSRMSDDVDVGRLVALSFVCLFVCLFVCRCKKKIVMSAL